MTNQSSKVDYSVVVPVYNSELSLTELCQRTIKLFTQMKASFEIILVDDGSKDNSWKVMQQLHAKDKRIKVIQLMKNFGQNNALMCGFNNVNGAKIVTIDDDLQNPPEEIPRLIKKLEEGYDVVYAQYKRKEHRFVQNLGSAIVKKIVSRVIGLNFNITSFRIMNRKVIDKITHFKNYNPNVDICISNVLSMDKISFCFVNHEPRKYGTTNYTFKKLAIYALTMIFNSTTYPLRLATVVGFLFSMISIFFGIYYLVFYFTVGVEISGWTTLILAVTFFSGAILFVLGIIGEYLGKIFLNVNYKPQYVMRHIKK